MRLISQEELQGIYSSPTERNREELHMTLMNLPRKESIFRQDRKHKTKMVFALAALLVLITGMTALAVSNSVWLTWGGKQIDEPHSTAYNDDWNDEKSEQMQDILATAPDGHYATIDWLSGSAGSAKKKQRTVSSLDRLLELLDTAGYPHPAHLIPDGYSFSDATLLIGCAPEGAYHLVSKTTEDDFLLEQYSINPEDEIIIGYTVRIWSKPGQPKSLISIRSGLAASKNVLFGFEAADDVSAEAITVPGMEEGMLIRYKDDHSVVEMARRLDHPVTVCTAPVAFEEDLPQKLKPTTTYLYERYSVSEIPLEEILQLFAGEQQAE